MKKCPPGVICIENVSIFFIIMVILIIGYLVYITINQNQENNDKKQTLATIPFISYLPNYPYNNYPSKDVLNNPYVPPLRDERYFIPELNFVPKGSIPINISTNIGAVDTNYRQLGILTASNSNGKMIPLMGRPLFTNRDKWQYYTMSDQYNSVKLPISRNGKSCTNEYGCDKLYNGDTVYIEGINEAYRVTVYDNDTIKYLPFM
jgi:hypothetical protein